MHINSNYRLHFFLIIERCKIRNCEKILVIRFWGFLILSLQLYIYFIQDCFFFLFFCWTCRLVLYITMYRMKYNNSWKQHFSTLQLGPHSFKLMFITEILKNCASRVPYFSISHVRPGSDCESLLRTSIRFLQFEVIKCVLNIKF